MSSNVVALSRYSFAFADGSFTSRAHLVV